MFIAIFKQKIIYFKLSWISRIYPLNNVDHQFQTKMSDISLDLQAYVFPSKFERKNWTQYVYVISLFSDILAPLFSYTQANVRFGIKLTLAISIDQQIDWRKKKTNDNAQNWYFSLKILRIQWIFRKRSHPLSMII